MVKKSIVLDGKLAIFWILGSLALLFAAWIIGHIQGLQPILFIAFLLILFAGLTWVGVGVGVSHKR